jgi:hypothetical protein
MKVTFSMPPNVEVSYRPLWDDEDFDRAPKTAELLQNHKHFFGGDQKNFGAVVGGHHLPEKARSGHRRAHHQRASQEVSGQEIHHALGTEDKRVDVGAAGGEGKTAVHEQPHPQQGQHLQHQQQHDKGSKKQKKGALVPAPRGGCSPAVVSPSSKSVLQAFRDAAGQARLKRRAARHGRPRRARQHAAAQAG